MKIAKQKHTRIQSKFKRRTWEALSIKQVARPKFEFEIRTITAKPRQLSAGWTVEIAQDLRPMYSMNLERYK